MKRLFMMFMALGVTTALLAAERLYVNDVVSNPQRYFNSEVEFEGDVTSVMPGGATLTTGSYALTDETGGTIEIRSRDLPAIGKHFIVKGVVSQDSMSGIAYLRETERGGGGFPVWGLIVAIAVFVGLVVALVVIVLKSGVFRGAQASRAPVANAQSSTAAPASRTNPREDTVRYDPRQATVAWLDVYATLTVIEGPADGDQVYPIVKQNSIIGRSGDIRLSASHLTVSGEHARITYDGGEKFTIVHLSETNTTRVNQESLAKGEPHEIRSGDVVQLGATKLRFEIKA